MKTPQTVLARPILLIGATGLIGRRVAHTLRDLYPELPLAVAGRDIAQSEKLAIALGNAVAVSVDLAKKDLDVSAAQVFGAVAVFMKDDSLNTLIFAQTRHIPYMDISSAAFEIGPEIAQYIHHPTSNAVLMNSNWLAGTSTNVALYFARDFTEITGITVSALLDSEDIGGAAADTDYERQTEAVTSALVLQNGLWQWLHNTDLSSTFVDSAGIEHAAQAFSNLDVLSLAAATTAKDVRFEFAVGETAGRRSGKHFSHEIILQIAGIKQDGQKGTFRYEIIHPEGQAPMTALSAAVGIETLIGLVNGTSAASPGIYLPSTLIDSNHAVERLRAIGTIIHEIK